LIILLVDYSKSHVYLPLLASYKFELQSSSRIVT
jgi:hypothetical protein